MPDAALTFTGLALGYAGHPSVHHLCGSVPKGSLTAVMEANPNA